MITTENPGYRIEGKKLLDGISACFKAHEISMIIGPNGAGKSTLIKLLSGEITPTAGTVSIEEKDIRSASKTDLAKNRAVLSQGIELAFPLTVEEVVMMGRYPHFGNHPSPADKEICRESMAYFQVDTFINRNYMTLSGGEKQRVHFARIAAQIWPDATQSTKYLLLDEPLSHLDIYYQYDFMGKLKDLMKNQPMVVIGVVHDLNLAYRFADQILLLHNAKLLASGTPQQVFTKEYMQAAFLMEPSFLENEHGERFLCF